MSTTLSTPWKLTLAAATLWALCGATAMAAGEENPAPASPAAITKTADAGDTSTDFLSDDAWRALPREERRGRARRSMIARYEPDGATPTSARLQHYVDTFARLTVYDPRYYLYNVTATHVAGTTGSVELKGEVYPASYKHGIVDALEALGFNIVKNDIHALPDEPDAFAVSTTTAATLRREPCRKAEQINSVGMGGWVRLLRDANESDLTTGSTGGRRAPGADRLPPESPSDWALAQTMEGYLGFVRKSDFRPDKQYRLPDGLLKFPAKVSNYGELPAGVFVYGSPEAGWHLYTGEKLPADAQVTDLRPTFKAEDIKSLMKPFMQTCYVWGGVTDEGIDCSGFSQFFMRTNGVMLPRDAVQQATSGLIVGWGLEQIIQNAKPGDLIFFATDTGRISHVAISLGGVDIIHSAGPGVHISRLDEPKDENSSETYGEGALFARRISVR